ncbi:hypothetical protein [Desulfovibrio sp. Huiquan2017]|uniref:hypothetical protein n=1 Tax=Desulfovibrio sp. Huiquan2017 TaxID=2816861 RepID=UPI001A92985D|nr:hypothetical protein [Desulfovibrio sp. Huiquan2017]
MLDRIEVDKRSCALICPVLFDGRIEKIRMKRNNNIIYMCEECETVWERLEDIVNQIYGPAPISGYMKQNGIDTKLFRKEDWDKHVEHVGFLTLEEIEPLVKNISVDLI